MTEDAFEDCGVLCHYEGEVKFCIFSWNFSGEFKNA